MTIDERVALLEQQINKLQKSDRFTIYKTLQMNDGRNMLLGQTTGTKIGTATSQKLAFWNATPVVQPTDTGAVSGMTTPGGANVQENSAFNGAFGSTKYTIHGIVKALKQVGILPL